MLEGCRASCTPRFHPTNARKKKKLSQQRRTLNLTSENITTSTAKMARTVKKTTTSQNSSRTFNIPNKLHRQSHNVRIKSALASQKRSERFERKKAEARDPSLREKRIKTNIPATIERKRVWDERVEGAIPGRRETAIEAAAAEAAASSPPKKQKKKRSSDDMDTDSDADSESESEEEDDEKPKEPEPETPEQIEARLLAAREKEQAAKADSEETQALFPTLLTTPAAEKTSYPVPRILITTSRNCHVHQPAEDLTMLFPNATYIPRGRPGTHAHSIKEICTYAATPTTTDADGSPREPYTHVLVANEDRKILNALTIIVLPAGPTFHFSLTNYTPAKHIRGHGNPTSHIPELILNNFLTPLGRVTASLFQSMFPRQPEIRGRQVVTLHNQRDFIFLRRHRYVFRDRREGEKPVGYGLEDGGKDGGNGSNGMEGDVKVGLQELGPRFTLKLRRVERGVKDGVEWEWKGGMDKDRKKFQL
ncbi:uncharacterized protein LAJ45_09718 [Morchella importuna]|nr:uncharacterized protein LAJ45_09718 [Morchella importuna]KAH8146276.1 hypothetical protein LAJ45_09718 [Morchella importuna]